MAGRTKKKKVAERSQRVHAPDPSAERNEAGHIIRDALLAIALIVAFIGLTVWFEHTRVGHDLELLAYQYLQQYLGDGPVRVAILDLKGLEAKETDVYGVKLVITPRDELSRIIQQVANH